MYLRENSRRCTGRGRSERAKILKQFDTYFRFNVTIDIKSNLKIVNHEHEITCYGSY